MFGNFGALPCICLLGKVLNYEGKEVAEEPGLSGWRVPGAIR